MTLSEAAPTLVIKLKPTVYRGGSRARARPGPHSPSRAPPRAATMQPAPASGEEQLSLQESINARLVESGERERLKQLLRERLIECGWRDDLKEQCKRIVRERGLENVTTEELTREITPAGRATVPDEVKAELLANIRRFLDA